MRRAMAFLRERPTLIGAAWLFLAVNVANVLAYLYQVVMARLLTTGDFALLVSLFAVLIVEAQGIQLLQNTAAKVVADRRAGGDIAAISAFTWRWGGRVAAGAVPAGLVVATAAALLGFPPQTVVLLALSLFFAAIFAFGVGVLQGLGRFGWVGGAYIAQAGARLALGVALVVGGLGVIGAFTGAAAAIALSLVAVVVPLRAFVPFPRAGERPPAAGGLFLGAATLLLFYALQVNVDAILAPRLLAPEQAGVYAAAVTMGKIALFVPLGLSIFLLERTATAHALGRPTRPALLAVLVAVLGVSGAVALVYLVLPEPAARIVAGDAYAPGVSRIVGTYGLVALSNALLSVWAVYFVGVGRLRVAAVFVLAVAVLVVALTIVARDPLGMARVVLAVTLATQAVVVGVFLRTRA